MVPPRMRLIITTVIACVIAALIAVYFASKRDQGSAASVPSGPGLVGSKRPPDIPPKDFVLSDQDGKRVSLAAYRGNVVLLTFMYSTCQDTCPIQADQIRGAFDQLGKN